MYCTMCESDFSIARGGENDINRTPQSIRVIGMLHNDK